MDFQIISRAEAIARGLDYYFTGKPCSRGGVARRRVNGGHCLCDLCQAVKKKRDLDVLKANPERLEKKRAYDRVKQKEYKAENRDKIREQKKRRYHKNKEREAERCRIRRQEHGDRLRAKQKEWRDANHEHMQRYYQENKANYLVHTAKRRAAQLNATPPWSGELDEFVIAEAYAMAAMRTNVTGVDWHVDHMVPLQAKNACGLHVWNNVQVIPAWLNLFKKNKLILIDSLEWVRFAFP